MSAQDLFLAFVFAVPTALHNSFLKTGGGHAWLKTLLFDVAVTQTNARTRPNTCRTLSNNTGLRTLLE
jgi:hypothetical protein